MDSSHHIFRVARAMKLSIPSSIGLLHQAHPPGENAIIGLAAYKTFKAGFIRLVGSLRYSNYTGQIILGVHPQIPLDEIAYLKRMDVTMYTVEPVECDKSISPSNADGPVRGVVRAKCSKGW